MAKLKKAQAGLKASAKRVGPVDPQGAWTKVQEQTLAGKKTPVSLKKDKQLGATKMKKGGVVKAQKGSKIETIKQGKGKGVKPNPRFLLELEKFKHDREVQRYRMDEKKKTEEAQMPKSYSSKAKDGKWIQKAIKKPGALRKSLGAKPGKPIPAAKLAAAAKKPGKLGQRARLAQTLKKMKKK